MDHQSHNKNNNDKKIVWYIKYFKPLIIIIPLLILVAGYFVFLQDVYGEYNQSKSYIGENQNQLQAKKAQLLSLNKVHQGFKDISLADRARVADILPETIDESSLYVNIEKLITDPGVTGQLEDVFVSPYKEENTRKKKDKSALDLLSAKLNKANVSLSVSSINYINLKVLFELIEKNIRLFDVKSFSYTAKDGELEIMMMAYFLE